MSEGTNELIGLVILSCKHNSPLWSVGSDEQRQVMRECRGAVFETQTGRAVCVPFFKFFNAGEPHAQPLDWAVGTVAEEKVDGCLLKLFHWHGRWRLASNRRLDVTSTSDKYACTGRTNRQLFDEAAAASGLDYLRLHPRRCYLFERVHPDFKIVVPYERPALWHLGTRELPSLQELFDDDIGVPRPRRWQVDSLRACRRLLEATSGLPEGLVVREAAGADARGGGEIRRLKLKRPEYVWLHTCANGGHGQRFDPSWVARCARIDAMAAERACLNAWLRGEEAELRAYYPDVALRYDEVAGAVAALLAAGALRGADPAERHQGIFVHEEALWQLLRMPHDAPSGE